MKEHIALASLTTLGVGGPARFFVEAHSEKEVRDALAFARTRELPVFILGGGSNIVIADSGFDGLVLALRTLGITERVEGDHVFVTVDAGVVWDDFVLWTIDKGFSGLECLSGIPGTVGGAVVANLGAYGAQVSDTFVHAEVLDMAEKAEPKVFRSEDCAFSYHDSVFGRESGRYVVLRATFVLSRDSAALPAYRDNRFDLAALTEELGHTPTQRDVREAVLRVREEKGSLIMKDRLSFKSAGSFFHMPFVSKEKYEEITARARARHAEKEQKLRPWAWQQKDGSYKIAPGFLLEYTEFVKGFVRGGVGISPRHTLSIINVAGGHAADIAALARDMQDAVENIFGIRLEREVEYIGDVERD